MADGTGQGCGRCRELEKEVQELSERVRQLEAELAKAKKDSTNSSKPPSSDQEKSADAKKDAKQHGKRKRGGQPGHERHERPAFAESEIDYFYEHFYRGCPDCGSELSLQEKIERIIQQIELQPQPIRVTEHRSLAGYCPCCDKTYTAPIPDDIQRAGLVGPRLTSLVAYLKGACHCSFSTIRKYLRDVVGVTISRGHLRKLIAKVNESLAPMYRELAEQLPLQVVLNVDETGHRDNGNRMWTWCFRASLFTLFKIDASRGSQVLLEMLGDEFNGVLGCDYFSAYRKYMRDCNVVVQFCLAHLIRDIKFLVKHPDQRNHEYGQTVLEATRRLFEIISRQDELTSEELTSRLEQAGVELMAQVLWKVPDTAEAQNLAARFQKHGDSYLQFITTPGLEPTNNLAEQAIRFVVIDRHITQGSRSEAGQRWLERIWTAIATCTQQSRSVFEFLYESVSAFFQDQPPPSLVPDTS